MTKKLPEEVKRNRKPISRACKFCHSKHLQCDPGRPCQNCKKRGLESSCENVERKKTKYLNKNEKRKPRVAKQAKDLQINKEIHLATKENHSKLLNQPSDLSFVNYTGDHIGKNIPSFEPTSNISLERSYVSQINTPSVLNDNTSPIREGLVLPSSNKVQPTSENRNNSIDMTIGYMNNNNNNNTSSSVLQLRKPEEHMFYNQSPSTSIETGSSVITPTSIQHQQHQQPRYHTLRSFSQASSTEYTPLQQHSSFLETNEDSDSSSSQEPEIRVRPNLISYHADTLDDVINKDDLNFMLNAYNKSIQESKVKFKSTLVNDEYAQLTSLLTTNPPSPSDFFDFEINERPYIQLGDTEPSLKEKSHNSIHINTSSFKTSDVMPAYIQDEQDYIAPLILRHIIKTPDDIYLTNVVKSYQYPKLYHALIHYLKQRFNRAQLLTIAKCMAVYRPSFISATKSLFENDLIFTEKSFQRSLLEYENFISMSATPTVIWRRTGEITALTDEFSALTGHTRVNLLSKRTFIVELMDDESALRYFKLFSDIAFGDLNATILTDCVIKKADPAGGLLKCASVWTIKRDVFDIPMLIVGQFLPIL